MAREILPSRRVPQADRADSGGILPGGTVKTLNYSAPQGPKGINNPRSVGLHGSNHGCTNGPDNAGSHTGRPGLGGKVHGQGTQGKH